MNRCVIGETFQHVCPAMCLCFYDFAHLCTLLEIRYSTFHSKSGMQNASYHKMVCITCSKTFECNDAIPSRDYSAPLHDRPLCLSETHMQGWPNHMSSGALRTACATATKAPLPLSLSVGVGGSFQRELGARHIWDVPRGSVCAVSRVGGFGSCCSPRRSQDSQQQACDLV